MALSEHIFLFLHGHWQLNRSINGHGMMKGMASFLPLHEDPLTLLYREEGEHITHDGASFSFFREYVYCLNQVYLDVYFAHSQNRGRLLYSLVFSGNFKDCLATGEHYCGKDIYAATYHFYDLNRFTLQYDIRGPKKNLKIQTFFQR